MVGQIISYNQEAAQNAVLIDINPFEGFVTHVVLAATQGLTHIPRSRIRVILLQFVAVISVHVNTFFSRDRFSTGHHTTHICSPLFSRNLRYLTKIAFLSISHNPYVSPGATDEEGDVGGKGTTNNRRL